MRGKTVPVNALSSKGLDWAEAQYCETRGVTVGQTQDNLIQEKDPAGSWATWKEMGVLREWEQEKEWDGVVSNLAKGTVTASGLAGVTCR